MRNDYKIRKEDLDDYKYLYEEKDFNEFGDENEEELDIEKIDITDIENYDYIKNMSSESNPESNNEKVKFLLDKEGLDALDSEDLGTEYWEEIVKGRRKAEPPKEPLSAMEKEIIAEENMALVHYVIKSLYSTQLEYDELFSIAIIGYAKALNSYDKSKNVKFSTYAINCIRNEIFYVLRKEKKHLENTTSLNKILSTDKNGNSLQLGDTLSEEEMNAKSLEDIILEDENRQILMKALEHLKEEERFILIYRFGLDRGITKTQKEIADAIGMSQANVSKIQKSCLSKLKLILKKEMKHF